MKILIATGVFPPDIGGPAQYAKNLYDEFAASGHEVAVARYGIEHSLPVGVRHIVFFGKALVHLFGARYALAMDTFSVGVPAILAARLIGAKVVVRIAGDFLWESYVERTGNLITLRDFYSKMPPLSLKEKMVFWITRKILPLADKLVFTTQWQRDIFMIAHDIPRNKATIIENYFPPQEKGIEPVQKNFVWATRPMKLKNGRMLYRAFTEAKKKYPELVLDDGRYPHDVLMERIKSAYAVILPSISDVSPNLITDGIRFGKPFIMTKESGYAEQLKDVGLLVNPFSEQDIEEKILTLVEHYDDYKKKVETYPFTHSYSEIASEYLKLFNRV